MKDQVVITTSFGGIELMNHYVNTEARLSDGFKNFSIQVRKK